jgi:putative DNA primase/helicase
MNSGNLLPVAMGLRKRYPALPLIIAGDDDRLTKGNPGRAAANAAAAAVGGLVTFPDWPDNAPDNLTDFNDLQLWKAKHASE